MNKFIGQGKLNCQCTSVKLKKMLTLIPYFIKIDFFLEFGPILFPA